VFYVNLPFGAIAMALIATALVEEARPALRPVMDVAGVALFTAGVSALLLGIVQAGRAGSWSGAAVLSPLALGLTGLVLFVVVERRAAEPIVPLRLFGSRMVIAAVGMGLVVVPMPIAVQSAAPRRDLGAATSMTQFFMSIGGAVGLSVMGAVMAQRLDAGRPMAEALHGVFLVGFAVCVAAVVSTLLVPAGRARGLARGEPTGGGGRIM